MRHWFVMAALATGGLIGPAHAAGDAALGKAQFGKCSACHSINAGENKVGPSLHGIVGRQSGAVEGYNYTEAMKNYKVTWNAEELDKYLENPRGVVPGTRMIYPGLKKEEDRVNLIAYLETLK